MMRDKRSAVILKQKRTPKTLKELQRVLFKNRNIADPDLFLSPAHPLQCSAADVGISTADLEFARERINAAIVAQEHIVIYGDYDADGISATAILWQALHAAGARVKPFIPIRDEHGYGLSEKGLESLQADESPPQLLITVDNGIVALPALEAARRAGMDVIITDHHQPESDGERRERIHSLASAVVHTSELCGAGVAWFLAREWSADKSDRGLDLVGLATIADQVPLLNWNRSMVVHGLQSLQHTSRVGLQALAASAGVDLHTLSARGVGFSLAPRINAMGRLAHGLDALRLLCTNSRSTAARLALTLSDTNLTRQELTGEQYELALRLVADQVEERVLIVAHESFHEGVIGLIAGRLVEQYSKPAVVIQHSDTLAKGSARSVPGVNIVSLLRQAREHLIDVGGHPMAAGFSLQTGAIAAFREVMNSLASDQISDDQLELPVEAECTLPPEMINQKLLDMINEFAPFGTANEEPRFLLEDMAVVSSRWFGKDKMHLALTLALSDGMTMEAVAWRYKNTETPPPSGSVSLVCSLELSQWNGKSQIQAVVHALV